jgi:hypothetical protein
MPVATAKIMTLHAVLKTKTFPWHSFLLCLKEDSQDTHGFNLLSDFSGYKKVGVGAFCIL